MFIVFLRFSDNKGNAGQFMEGHKEWLKRGFDDCVIRAKVERARRNFRRPGR